MGENIVSRIDFESYYYLQDSYEKFNAIENYLSIMDKQVTTIEQEQSKQLKEDIENIPHTWSDNDIQSYIKYRNDEYQQFERFFAENFRYSFIVLVWLVIEDELKRVCAEIQRRKGLVPKKWESRPGIIEQCKGILKEIADVSIENISHWSSICDLQKIRDCIAHTAGYIDESRDKDYLNKLIERKQLGLQNNYGRLRVTTEYCKLAIQNINEFFDVYN